MRLNLSACSPFSFQAVVESHGWVQLLPFSVDQRAGALYRVERLGSGRVVELTVREVAGGVTVEVRDQLSGAEREEVGRKVWWMLGLGEDLGEFYRLVRQEPRLAHMERRGLGRLLRSPTVFEDLVKVILTTNISWTGTVRMTESLVSGFGDPLPTDPSRNAFPTPSQLARSEEELRDAGLGYRARFLARLAQKVVAGELDLEAFKDGGLSAEQIRHALLDIKGVGGYGASMLMMLLGHYGSLPVDTWARKLVGREWYDGRAVESAQVEQAFERWDEWKGLAYWFWDWTLQNGGQEL